MGVGSSASYRRANPRPAPGSATSRGGRPASNPGRGTTHPHPYSDYAHLTRTHPRPETTPPWADQPPPQPPPTPHEPHRTPDHPARSSPVSHNTRAHPPPPHHPTGDPTMTPRWATSTRKYELPKDWPQRRKITRRQARDRCEGPVNLETGRRDQEVPRCENTGTDCDHVGDRDDHSLTNLQWLCTKCHEVKTKHEAREALRAKMRRGKRKPVPHPGLRPGGDGGSPQSPPGGGLPA